MSFPKVSRLETQLRLYEQALALHPDDPHLQRQVARLKAELVRERPVPPPPAPPSAGFQRVRPGDFNDPEAVKRAIQLYEKLSAADPSNKETEGTLHLLRERLHTLSKPGSSAFKRPASRRRVDVL